MALEAASSTAVGIQEQQHDHDEKQKNKRVYEGAAGETENDQSNDDEQKLIHKWSFRLNIWLRANEFEWLRANEFEKMLRRIA